MKSETDLRNMLKECLNYDPSHDEPHLTDWEIEFLDSLNRRNFLTEKQASILETIWRKCYG